MGGAVGEREVGHGAERDRGADDRRHYRLHRFGSDAGDHVGDARGRGPDRRRVHHQHRVDRLVVERGPERDAVLLRPGVVRKAQRVRHGPVGEDKPCARTGLGGQPPGAARVADHGNLAARGDRLPGQYPCDVEQLVECVDPEHPDLAQERLHQRFPSAADGHDRLASRHAPSDPGERPRVPERLEMEKHNAGALVALPVAEEVVAAEVGLVAQRHERGQAQAEPGGPGHDRGPHRPRLGAERGPTGTDGHRDERAVGLDVGRGVDGTHRAGADEAHPVEPRCVDDGAYGVVVGEPGRDHQHPGHTLAGALIDHRGHDVGGNRDQRQVDRAGDVVDRPVHHDTGDSLGRRVHRVDVAGEPVNQEVGQQLVADGARFAARTDHCDRPRFQQSRDRPGLGPLRTLLHRGERLGCRIDRHPDLNDAVGERAAGLESGLLQHRQHAAVRRKYLGRERLDPDLAGAGGEVLEQHGRQAAAVVDVVGGERDLRVRPARPPLVAGGADDVVSDDGHEPHTVDVVDRHHPLDLARRQVRHGAEEPEVDALG